MQCSSTDRHGPGCVELRTAPAWLSCVRWPPSTPGRATAIVTALDVLAALEDRQQVLHARLLQAAGGDGAKVLTDRLSGSVR